MKYGQKKIYCLTFKDLHASKDKHNRAVTIALDTKILVQ